MLIQAISIVPNSCEPTVEKLLNSAVSPMEKAGIIDRCEVKEMSGLTRTLLRP
jgi:hypothetical protein